MIQDKEK